MQSKHDVCTLRIHDIAKPQEEEGAHRSGRGELNDEDNLEHLDGGDGHEEEGEEPSALEKILPQFPAARKQVFVKVEAVLGLLPPFTKRGRSVSARIFWGGQEVSSPPKKNGTTATVDMMLL